MPPKLHTGEEQTCISSFRTIYDPERDPTSFYRGVSRICPDTVRSDTYYGHIKSASISQV